ncbi:MAG: hypothetical protein GX616_02295 [Planctomycetes bacterium]|nr:hypothetical protein [Planctomycetota bacterium]
MARRRREYAFVLKPSVDYLAGCGCLLISPKGMAEFLGVPVSTVHPLASTDRIPVPLRLGFGHSPRWSVLELLEWVSAGCPRRGEWIKHRGWSGSFRRRGHGLLWQARPRLSGLPVHLQ